MNSTRLPLVLTVAALVMLSCMFFARPTRNPLPPLADMPRHRAEDVLRATPVDRATEAAFSLLAAPAAFPGYAQRTHGNSACQTRLLGLPYMLIPDGPPTAGQRYDIEFRTCILTPQADFPMCLLVGTKPLDLDLSPWGHTGCHLLVSPEWFLWPSEDHDALLYRKSLTSGEDTGRMWLRWLVPQEWRGAEIFLQLLVIAPRSVSSADFVLSHGLRIIVGAS